MAFLTLLFSPLFTAASASIPFSNGTPEEILSAIDQSVAKKPSTKAELNALTLSLAKALKNTDTPVKIRERSAWALGQLRANSQISVLSDAAKDKGLIVRSQALDSLIILRAPNTLPILTHVALNDPTPSMRYRAIIGMGLLQSDKSIKNLVTLSSDPKEEIRAASTLAMAPLHSKKNDFSAVFSDMRKDPSDFVQKCADVGTDIINKKSSEVAAHLESTLPDIRLFSALYFKNSGKKSDLKILQATLNGEPSENVRIELESAIAAIKKRDAEAQARAKAKAKAEAARKAAALQKSTTTTGAPSK